MGLRIIQTILTIRFRNMKTLTNATLFLAIITIITYSSCSLFQPKKSPVKKSTARITSKSRASSKIINTINTFTKRSVSLRSKKVNEKTVNYTYTKTGDYTQLSVTLIITVMSDGTASYEIIIDKTVTTGRSDITEHLDTTTTEKKEVIKFVKENL